MRKLLAFLFLFLPWILLAQTPPGGYVSPQPGGSPFSSTNTIYAMNFGAIPDGQTVCDAVVTNVSHTVTSATAHFSTNAKNGQIVFATSGHPGCITDSVADISSVLVLPVGTLTVNNDTTITVTTTGNASASGIANSVLTWGTDNDAALHATWTAATAQPMCLDIDLPSGMMLDTLTSGQFDTVLTCQNTQTHSPQGNLTIRGHGRVSTLIVPTPASNMACPASGAFFGGTALDGVTYQDWGISGQGWNNVGAVTCSIASGRYDAFFLNFSVNNWGANSTATFYGLNLSSSQAQLAIISGAGSIPVFMTGGAGVVPELFDSFVGNGHQVSVWCDTGSVCSLLRNGIGPTNCTICVPSALIVNHGTMTMDQVWTADPNLNIALVNNYGTINANHVFVSAATHAGASAYLGVGASSVLHTTQSTWTGNASGYGLFADTATGKIFDDGGNSIGGGTLFGGIGELFGDSSITGSPLVTSNIVLTSGWDTSTKTGISGATKSGKFEIDAAGTPTLNPVITLTFPVSFWAVPSGGCKMQQIGGTGVLLDVTTGTVTATTAPFTVQGTPVAGLTYIYSFTCSNP